MWDYCIVRSTSGGLTGAATSGLPKASKYPRGPSINNKKLLGSDSYYVIIYADRRPVAFPTFQHG